MNVSKDFKTRRVQMDMPRRSMERLEALKIRTESTSYAEVVKNALQVYEAIIDEVEQGNEIMVKRGDEVVCYKIIAVLP